MRLAEHVARMGEKRGLYRVSVAKSEGKRQTGRPRGRWISKKWDGGAWTGLICLRTWTGSRNL